ncbi:proton-conducting transporter membrane subunit [Hippea maritima]|uniref:NADH/Ubiquinone/plastoquinone (Complex I) n=1 Tax=Hippea maritima (strain ATCC 700847 / DSM 10411 / MH2) TaxID=760142 RepID=F2LXG0_HIPMA|nr:proton-conducting transporter membrane subunit [Hippea maritima]AEA34274.1 NADH/Ubiquinone/plastoquinone (complex I) [Hippea maritima DSM 10411]
MIEVIIGTFITGALLGFAKKQLSYTVAAIASLLSFILGFKATFSNLTITHTTHLIDSINIGFYLDKTSGLFLMIASISWFAISLFSVDFGERYKQRMSIFINLAMLGMFLLLVSYDMLMLLIGLEVMTISSYMLIAEHGGSYKEAYEFLAFSEISTLSLIIAAAALFASTKSFGLTAQSQSLPFIIFASLGFMIKMDIVPFHTWLKRVYSKAPANASAILSASMTLMGVYGIIRTIQITGYMHGWGIAALILGSISAFWGAIGAAASKELNVLPAYSTIENNGMILALLGLSAIAYSFSAKSTLYEFAFLGAIVIALSHTTAKTLMFLSIGEAKERLQEETIDSVRGIYKSVGKIPALGILTSGLSFGGFPLFLGYIAEWMLLESVFQSYQFTSMLDRITSSAAGILMALAMGFVSFSMIKLIGYSALGYHHNKKALSMPVFAMHLSQLLLTILLIGFGGFASLWFIYLGYPQFVGGLLGVPNGWLILSAKPIFGVVSPAFLMIVILVLFILPFTVYIKTRKTTKRVVSWNGGLKLEENEYFTVNAFSFILEYVLRFIYNMKEIKQNKEAFVVVVDVFDLVYQKLTKLTKKTTYIVSHAIMNGKISFYVFYILAMFIITIVVFSII